MPRLQIGQQVHIVRLTRTMAVEVGRDDTVLDGSLGPVVAIPHSGEHPAQWLRRRTQDGVTLVVLVPGQARERQCDRLRDHLADRAGPGQPTTPRIQRTQPGARGAIGGRERLREQLEPGANGEADPSPSEGSAEARMSAKATFKRPSRSARILPPRMSA